jgi:hypothetical protein
LSYDHDFFDSSKTRKQIQQAFDDWARYSGLTFREVIGHQKADFNLNFAYGDHGDDYPFQDGRNGVLAHAFYPRDSYRGDIHFDSVEKWSEG